jgi:hypothetical protein
MGKKRRIAGKFTQKCLGLKWVRFDVKKIANALKEREQMHPDSIRTPREFPVRKMAV